MKRIPKKESRNKIFHRSLKTASKNGLRGVSHEPTRPSFNGDLPNGVSPEPKKKIEKRQSPNAISQPPSWLGDSSTKDPQYLAMRETFIREVAPRDAVEWILLLEFINLQWQVMKFAKLQAALLEIAHLRSEGLNRAVKRRLRTAGESEDDLDQRVARHALGMRNIIPPDEIEAETFLSRHRDLEPIYRRLVSVQRRRNAALREIEQRRIRMAKQVVQTSAAFAFPLSRNSKNGESSAPEAWNSVPGEGSPLTTRRNGH